MRCNMQWRKIHKLKMMDEVSQVSINRPTYFSFDIFYVFGWLDLLVTCSPCAVLEKFMFTTIQKFGANKCFCNTVLGIQLIKSDL